MAITRDGVWSENGTIGDFWYGSFSPANSVGSLTVNGGDDFDMTGAARPALYVGVTSSSLPPALNTGTVTVTGSGSSINLIAPLNSGDGAEVFIGRNGGNGTLNITAGGLFKIEDAVNTSSFGGAGREILNVGTRSGGVGVVTVNNGDLFMSGTGADVTFGRGGGNGTLNISNFGEVYIRSTGTDSVDDNNNAALRIGGSSGTGTLNMTNGLAVIQGAANGTAGFKMGIAFDGDPAATGTATITGTAGLLQGILVLGGADSAYAEALLGVGVGSIANMTLTNAGLAVSNSGYVLPSSTWEASQTIASIGGTGTLVGEGGEAIISIGREGAVATLTASGAIIRAEGQTAYLQIGNNGGTGTLSASAATKIEVESEEGSSVSVGNNPGGTGTLTLSGLSMLDIRTIGTSSDDRSALGIGRNGGNGTLNITNSLAVIQASSNNEAEFLLGASFDGDPGSTGTATITGTDGRLQGIVVLGGADTEFTQILIGNGQGSSANMTLTNAVLSTRNDGDLIDQDDLDPNALLTAVGGAFGPGGNGGEAQIVIGRDNAVATVTANNGIVDIYAQTSANLRIGDNGGTGTLNALNGTLIQVGSESTQADVKIGVGGTGTFILTGSDIDIQAVEGAELVVGAEGGTGVFTATNSTIGLEVSGTPTNSYTNLIIGARGGTGTVTLDNSDLDMRILNGVGGSGIVVGHWYDRNATDAGDGTFIMKNGSTAILDGGEYDGSLEAGGGAGSRGEIEILSGSTVDLGGNGYVRLGGVEGTAYGSLLIDGAGSRVFGYFSAWIGANVFDTPTYTSGTANLTLTNGGSIGSAIQPDNSPYTNISQGGTLFAGVGTVLGELNLWDGGTMDLRANGLSTLTVTGRFNIVDDGESDVFMEVGASGSDRMNVSGELFLGNNSSTVNFTVAAAGGFQFAAGNTRTLLTAGDVVYDGSLIKYDVTGQHSGFAYTIGESRSALNQIAITALNSGVTGGAAVLALEGGAGQSGARVLFDMLTRDGNVLGGKFTTDVGAYFKNVSSFTGTALSDDMQVSDFSQAGAGVTFDGLAGDDFLIGGQGDDTLFGGAGLDSLTGGGGADTIYGGVGVSDSTDLADTINGNNGNDILHGNAGDDIIYGGADLDTVFGGGGNDTIYGGTGVADSTDLADTLAGQSGDDTIHGNGGDDTIYGGLGLDTVFGGGGNDLIFGGNTGADALDVADVIYGQSGDDTINGNGGDDQIYGGLGLDIVYGGGGNDLIFGGNTGADAADSADELRGQSGDDTIHGNGGDDFIYGGLGLDTVFGGGGNDTIYGGASAADTTDTSIDILNGQSGNDTIYGNGGNDTIQGGIGLDTIYGGLGNDILTGGADADRFVFDTTLSATNVDTIMDFVSGTDDIVLSQGIFGALALTPGFAAIELQLGNTSTSSDNNNYIIYNQSTGQLFYDADANGTTSQAVLFATVTTGMTLAFGDFILA